MKYRLVALDLDDTILDQTQTLSPSVITVIKNLERSGVKCIIATGRMLVSALPYVRELGLSGPVITYNGAYVKDIDNSELIYHRSLKADLAREVIAEADRAGLHINLYQDDQLYVEQLDEQTRYYEQTSGVKARVVDSLLDFAREDVTKLLIVEFDLEKKRHYLQIFQEKLAGRAAVTESKSAYIEFMARGVSKGKALSQVADRLGIGQPEVIAVGDSWNDLEMLRWAGLGIAMEDSPADLQKEADLVAPAPRKDGVALVLKEIFRENA